MHPRHELDDNRGSETIPRLPQEKCVPQSLLLPKHPGKPARTGTNGMVVVVGYFSYQKNYTVSIKKG